MGESTAYSSREYDIADVLVTLARQAQAGEVKLRLYGDQRVVYIDQGRTFLDYLCDTDMGEMLTALATADLFSADTEECGRTIEDLKDLKAKSKAWLSSVDPRDGSLRFYCD